MKVKLIGKSHVSGVSKKSGKPFDNNIAHVLVRDREVEGWTGTTVWLNPAEYPLESLIVDENNPRIYDLEYNNRGFVSVFQPSK